MTLELKNLKEHESAIEHNGINVGLQKTLQHMQTKMATAEDQVMSMRNKNNELQQ